MKKHSTIFDVPLLKYLLQAASLLFLKMGGWRRSGRPPALDKFVLIAAPHTSNWDLPLTLALAFSYRMKICWMGKAAIFHWPLGGFFRWLGGIPIDRSKANNVVAHLDDGLPPGIADVAFELGAERTVVIAACEAAVNFTGLEYETSSFAQRYDVFEFC